MQRNATQRTPERIALNPSGVTGCLRAAVSALIKAAITVIVILLGTLLTSWGQRSSREREEGEQAMAAPRPKPRRSRDGAAKKPRQHRDNATLAPHPIAAPTSKLEFQQRLKRYAVCVSLGRRLGNDFPESRLMWRGVIGFLWKHRQFFTQLVSDPDNDLLPRV